MQKLWMLSVLCITGIGLVLIPAVEQKAADAPVAAAAKHPLTGRWRIDYHPNQAIREYVVQADGCVNFKEFPEWKGKLAGNGGPQSGFLLRFTGDSEDRVERLTLIADGRLLVEHYNPGSEFTAERRPDQLGIGLLTR